MSVGEGQDTITQEPCTLSCYIHHQPQWGPASSPSRDASEMEEQAL
jgi:hypothetical protein